MRTGHTAMRIAGRGVVCVRTQYEPDIALPFSIAAAAAGYIRPPARLLL